MARLTYYNTWALCLTLILCLNLFFALHSVVHAAADVNVGWDPNSEGDLDGYGVYMRQDSPGPPCEHVDDVFADPEPKKDQSRKRERTKRRRKGVKLF